MRNVTTYTEEIYKIINRQRVFTKDAVFVGGIAMAITLNFAARAVYSDPNSVTGWITVAIGAIVIPFVVFIFPLRNAKKNYNKAKTLTKDGSDMVNTIDFEKDKIVCHNNMHQTANIRYVDVQEVVLTNRLIILKKDGKELVHIDRKGFVNGSDEECLNLLEEKCTKLNRPFRKKS